LHGQVFVIYFNIKKIFNITQHLLTIKIASFRFMSDLVVPDKKYLATYPVFLFYFFLSWLVMSH